MLVTASCLFLSATWSCQNDSSPPAPREPLAGELVINEFLAAPTSDANLDGMISSSQDEFIELVSTVENTLDLAGVTVYVGTGGTTLRHSFPATTSLAPHQAAVVFGGVIGGGAPSLPVPAQVVVQTASSGMLALADTGATIEVRNKAGLAIDSVTYGPATSNVSRNRDPELTGSFVDSTAIVGSVGDYSPGTKANGSYFH